MSKTIRPRPKAKRETRELAGALDAVEAHLRRFIVFPSDAPDGVDGFCGGKAMTVGAAQSAMVALWIAHAHAVDAFHVTPRMLFTSAEPESGKTTLLDVVAQLVPVPLRTANVSAAALYRALDAGMAKTILCDELDGIYSGARSEKTEELRSFINAGYRRGEATIRCVGKLMTPTRFETFAPVALAGIDNGHLPDTISTRSLFIRLKAKKSREHVEDFIPSDFEIEAGALRERLADCLDDDALDILRATIPSGLEELHNRRLEIARPLQTIAQAAGKEWAERSRTALLILLSQGRGETITVRLLRDLLTIFDEARRDRLFTQEILASLTADETAPWGRWKQGREDPSLNASDLARLLSRHQIAPKTIWIGDKSAKGYERAQFTDVWERHVTPFLASPSPPPKPSGASSRQEGNPFMRFASPPPKPSTPSTRQDDNPFMRTKDSR